MNSASLNTYRDFPKDSWRCSNILGPVLGQPFGYIVKHCSKSLLKKDFIPFLGSYAHSFTATCIFLPL
jgi:hypothetical protein